MVWKLRKAPKRDLYWVVDDKGKKYSKDPLPKERAEAQRRALYANEPQMNGAGFIDDLVSGFKEGAKPLKTMYQTAKLVGRIYKKALTGKGKMKGGRYMSYYQRIGQMTPEQKLNEPYVRYENARMNGFQGSFDDFGKIDEGARKQVESHNARIAQIEQEARDREARRAEIEAKIARNKPFEAIMSGLTKVADVGVKFLENVPGVGGLAAEAYKSFAPPGSEYSDQPDYYGSGEPCWKGYEMVGTKVKKGKKVPNCVPVGNLEGAGFFDSIKSLGKKVVNEVVNPDSVLRRRITDVSKGVRKNYSPRVRKMLERYGNYYIVGLTIRRDPIQSMLNVALNMLTLGHWNRAKAQADYDKLFHLGLIMTLQSPNGVDRVQLVNEKNEVINIGELKKQDKDTEFLTIPMPKTQLTLNEFMNNAFQSKGDSFFLYDAFSNNCQDYILGLLQANALTTPPAVKFIKQDTTSLLQRLPGYIQPLARGLTDVAATANVAIEGGKMPHNKFKAQLEKAGVNPEAYLKEAQARAKKVGLPYSMLGFANDGIHKLAIPDSEGRVIKFGRVGYGDHILYVLSGDKDADKHQKNYLKRSGKIKGDWESNPFSPNTLAREILWG